MPPVSLLFSAEPRGAGLASVTLHYSLFVDPADANCPLVSMNKARPPSLMGVTCLGGMAAQLERY